MESVWEPMGGSAQRDSVLLSEAHAGDSAHAARRTADIWRGVVGPNQDATLSYNAILDAVPPGASREDRARVFAAAREAGRPSR